MSSDITGISPPTGGTSVSEYGQLLRRFWWIVLICTLLGALSGLGVALMKPAQYTSTTTVLVGDTGIASTEVENARTSGLLNLDTEAQLVTSGTVGERAAQAIGYDGTVYSLRGKVAVRVPPNSSVLQIDFTAGTPERATEGSTAFAQAYLDNRRATAQTALENRSERLQASLTDLRDELARASARAEETKSVLARSEVEQLTQQIRTASAALSANGLQDIDPGSIISQASPPTSNGNTSLVIYSAAAGFLGLVVGLSIAVFCDRLRLGRVRPADVRALRPGSSYIIRRSAGTTGVDIGLAEARRMWAWLGRLSRTDLDSVVVSGVGPAVDASACAALALAEARAADGEQVAFSNSALDAEDVLVARGVFASLPATARSAKLRSVSGSSLLLTVPAPKGQELPGHVAGVLGWLDRTVDEVVYHVASLPDSPEAVDLAPDADVVVVMAVVGVTSRRDLDATLLQLRSAADTPSAVVLLPKVGHRWSRGNSRPKEPTALPVRGDVPEIAGVSESRDSRVRNSGQG